MSVSSAPQIHRFATTSSGRRMRWIGFVATILWWSGIARTLSSMNRGYKISPKPCRVPGQPNVEGTCMFVWECIKSEGTHVGVCVDTFMFGSCCVHNATTNSISSISNENSNSSSSISLSSRPRPTLAEALSGSEVISTTTTTRPRPVAVHGSARPSSSHISASQAGSHAYSHQSSGTSHPSASSRPSCRTGTSCSTQLQKRPHSKPNNSPEQDFHDHQHQQYQNNSITRRPQIDMDTSYHEKRPEEDRQHNGGSGGFHHYSYHQGYKDKVPSSQNSLLVRVPSKNSQHGAGSSSKNSYHHRPISSYQDEEQVKTDEQAQDLSVQETVHRPSINSLDDDVRDYFWALGEKAGIACH